MRLDVAEGELARTCLRDEAPAVQPGPRLSTGRPTPPRARARRASPGPGRCISSIEPWSGPVRPRHSLKVVVLPAPLGPSSPKHSPGAIAKLTPATTSAPP